MIATPLSVCVWRTALGDNGYILIGNGLFVIGNYDEGKYKMNRLLITLLFAAVLMTSAMAAENGMQESKLLKVIDLTEYSEDWFFNASSIYPLEHAPKKYSGIGLPQETRYELKGGYTLIFKPVLLGAKLAPGIQTQLQKDTTLFILGSTNIFRHGVREGQPLYDTRYLPRYQNVDFDDYFVLSFVEAQMHVRHVLYEKKNGAKIVDYYGISEVIADTDNNLLIYTERGKNDENIFLYDLKKQKKHFLDPYLERALEEVSKQEHCIISIAMWYADAFEIAAVSKKRVTIEFHGYSYGQYDPVIDDVSEWQDGYPVSFGIER